MERWSSMAMDLDSAEIFALLERRLRVAADLVSSLSAAKPRTPEATISFLEHRTAEQCRWLADWAGIEAKLEAEIGPWRRSLESPTGGGSNDFIPEALSLDVRTRWLEYRAFYRRLLGDLQAQCRLEAAVLRRSRRTAAALSSLLTGADSIYARPLPATNEGGGARLLLMAPKVPGL
jgi:hypothetical protein